MKARTGIRILFEPLLLRKHLGGFSLFEPFGDKAGLEPVLVRSVWMP